MARVQLNRALSEPTLSRIFNRRIFYKHICV